MRTGAKFVLLSIFIVLILILILIYLQTSSIETLENLSSPQQSPQQASPQQSPQEASPQQSPQEASPQQSPQPTWKGITMVHDTVLDPDDITNPILNENDIIYQSEKYQALLENGWLDNNWNEFIQNTQSTPVGTSCFTLSDIPSVCNNYCQSNAPPVSASVPTTAITKFPCSVLVAYSDYKDQNGSDPFANQIIHVKDYQANTNCYPVIDDNGNTVFLQGSDDKYPVVALNYKNNAIIGGWNQKKSDGEPYNNYPNKIIFYVKNVLPDSTPVTPVSAKK